MDIQAFVDCGRPREGIAPMVAFERFAFPGGYEIFAVTDDGGILCNQCCATEAERIAEAIEGDGFYVDGFSHTGDDDSEIVCDHCYRTIQEGPVIGTVKVIEDHGTIEDIDDGRASDWFSAEISETIHECRTVEEAAEIIVNAGCVEDSGSWYSDPDGSHTVNYGTGERLARTCHLDGWTAADEAAISALVNPPRK